VISLSEAAAVGVSASLLAASEAAVTSGEATLFSLESLVGRGSVI
jgi:hypothetical protein